MHFVAIWASAPDRSRLHFGIDCICLQKNLPLVKNSNRPFLVFISFFFFFFFLLLLFENNYFITLSSILFVINQT